MSEQRLAVVIPIDGVPKKKTAEEEFREAHESDCTKYLQALLAHPAEASSFIVPKEICATQAQHKTFEAIQMAVMHNKGPTPEAMADCLRQKGYETDVLVPFLDPYASKPEDMYDTAIKRVAAVRMRKALDGLHRDSVTLNQTSWVKKLNEALSVCSVSSGSKRYSITDLFVAAAEQLRQPKDIVKTGWKTVDNYLQLRPGDMVVIGARSGIGKTSVALTWCLHAARLGHPTCLVSLEDSKQVLGPRVVSQMTGIDQNIWNQHMLNAENRVKMERADKTIPFWVEHAKRDPVTVIRVLRSAAAAGAKMVVIDYIQRVRIDSKTNGLAELNNTIESLKSVAEDAGVILVLTSQLKRTGEVRKPKKGQEPELYIPTIEELKGTSELECGAQAVILLWGKRNGYICGKIGKSKNSGITDDIFHLVRDSCTGAVNEESRMSVNVAGERKPGWADD